MPTLHMGHGNVKPANTERYERLQKRHAIQDLWDQIPTVLDAEIEAFLLCEVEVILVKQINKAKQYFKHCASSSELKTICKELATVQQTVELLKTELALKDRDFMSDELVLYRPAKHWHGKSYIRTCSQDLASRAKPKVGTISRVCVHINKIEH